jgi:hypothetical protein
VTDTIDPLLALADDHFTLGPCRVLLYNRLHTSLYSDDLLSRLYDACLASRPSHPFGILPSAFCGMLDLSRDAMLSYWATRNPLLLLTLDHKSYSSKSPLDIRTSPILTDGTIVAGFSFITAFQGAAISPNGGPQPVGERSALGAYLYFRPFWGTPEIEILQMLGLALYFHTYSLSAIHGQRYSCNVLTQKFMSRFNSRDVGTLQRFLADRKDGRADGEIILSDCIVSELLRERFVEYVTRMLLSLVP